MAQKTNSFERFWQELKRRKTGKVIVAYAATAFILLQLADILTPALLLPEWTTRFVTLILIIGFPVAVIFSWVFDITPEGIKKTLSVEESEKKEPITKPVKRRILISNIIIAALIIVVGILAYPKIFKRNTLEKLRSSGERISVAVMPFRNMTNDTTLNIWQEAIQYNLILSLSNYSDELKVRPVESITGLLKKRGLSDYSSYASITSSVARNISHKLDADVFIYGSLILSGSTIRLNAQLVDSKTEEILKPIQLDGSTGNIISLLDSLKVIVRNVLVISKLGKELSPDFVHFAFSASPEAFRYFKSGQNAFNERDWSRAINFYSQAIQIDSNFNGAFIQLSMSYLNLKLYDQAKKCCLRLFKRLDNMPIYQEIMTQWLYSHCFETPHEEINYAKQLLEIDDQAPSNHFVLGMSYYSLDQYDNMIPEYEKALKIYRELGIIPSWAGVYSHLGWAYYKTGQFKKGEKLYKTMGKYFHNNSDQLEGRVLLALTEGDTIDADHCIEKLNLVRKDMLWSDARIISNLAWIYSNAGILDKAEGNYRQSLSLEPENPDRLNDLAYFLIDKNYNINEGLKLIEKALIISPDNYEYLHTKGLGLYKQRKHQEALDILQKSWDLRMKNAIYDHESFLNLEAAKKAIAGQKNY